MAMDVRQLLSRNVLRLRHERGWSQEALAEESGLHRTYVSGIERAARNPTVTIVARLAKALAVPVAELFRTK